MGDTFGTVLLVLCWDTWPPKKPGEQPEFLDWSPGTLRMEIDETFNVILPQETFDKLMACIMILTTDLFFTKIDRFNNLCNALAGHGMDAESFEPADSLECAWGITEALLLVPPDEDNEEPFSDEVRHYIGALLKEEGYVTPPDILRVALEADFSAQVQYDFADDPDMFQGIYQNQQDKTKRVGEVIRHGLFAMLGQIKSLPLQHGETVEIEKRISQVIRAA